MAQARLVVPGVAQLGDESAATSEDVLDSGDAAGMVIRGGASRTIGYVTGPAIGLLAVPLMIRELGVERYGYFVTAASIQPLVYAVTEGLAALGVREYATARESERKPMLSNLLGLGLALTIAAVMIAARASP